jgi:hypothetical protein
MQPDPNGLSAVLGPVTGMGSRTLTVTASREMSITVGCIGKGTLVISGPLSLGAELCGGPDAAGTFGGGYWSDLWWVRSGERMRLQVHADAKTIWDIRVDGLPRHCKNDACETAP